MDQVMDFCDGCGEEMEIGSPDRLVVERCGIFCRKECWWAWARREQDIREENLAG